MKIFEIYFSDLNEDAQKRLLEAVGAETAADMNWDIDMWPIAMYDFEEDKVMLNEKQIYNRMNQCYESEYGEYDEEAKWYGTDDSKEWLFFIPSQNINVKLLMDEEKKRIDIYERREDMEERDYERVGNYSW